MQRWSIRVSGVVQGVGFRPFVYGLAHRLHLGGWVRNDSAGVLIEVAGDEETLTQFMHDLRADAPPLAKITDIQLVECDLINTDRGVSQHQTQRDFLIVHSQSNGRASTVVPTDSHVCEACLSEMSDPNNRRYRYPFINCTDCGPRFSIIQGLPYDRAQTTMASFQMCDACRAEYENPLSRRYHAQPIACPTCGPQLQWQTLDGVVAQGNDALMHAKAALKMGQIVAIKSIGGFHLAVNAHDASAVMRLRQRKRRDAKPFALMVRDLTAAKKLAQVSECEADYLLSSARPIVLLKKIPHTLLPNNIAPNNPSLGVMLPSAPLHYLLLDEDLTALVMTSGNVSGYPIEFVNEEAVARLFMVADAILMNDRDIHMRVDDSVVRCTEHPQLLQPLVSWLRKGRGYAPYALDLPQHLVQTDREIVAFGAELKNTVALSTGARVYISQHIGDLKNADTHRSQSLIVDHLNALYEIHPTVRVYDQHPSFLPSVSHDREVAQSVDIFTVQHHHAHMAACMAEHGLSGSTLGVVFDGVGFGSDGKLWGGEFLYGDYAQIQRVAHLRAIPLLGGDKAVYEPIRIAWALLQSVCDEGSGVDDSELLGLDAQQKRVFQQMLSRQLNTFMTSSMGRLFDGVAALLGVCTYAEYEAQGPIELEGLLNRDLTMVSGYQFDVTLSGQGTWQVDYRPVIEAIVCDLKAKLAISEISRRFHSAVVAMIVQVCQQLQTVYPFEQVVLSGGVFHNEFVAGNTLIELNKIGMAAFAHQQVSCGDGGIALGQVMVVKHQLAK